MGFFENLFRYFFPKLEEAPAPQRTPSPQEPRDQIIRSLDLESFSYEVVPYTDVAIIALFDPDALAHRIDTDNEEWWVMDFHTSPEIKNGVIAMIATFADGGYDTRLTNQDLTDKEKYFVKFVVPEMGVHIVSGQLYIGGAEEMPAGHEFSGGGMFSDDQMFSIKNGDYTVRIFGLDTDDFDHEFNDEEKEMAEGLPQLVIQILPGKAKVARLKEEPNAFGDSDAKYVMRAKKTKTTPRRESVEVAEGNGLAGKTVVFTGKLTKFTRKEAEAAAKKQGASVGSTVTEKTNLLVIGEAPGSKATKARELGIEIITEDQWLDLIGS